MATIKIIANQEAEFHLLTWKLPLQQSSYHSNFLWNGAKILNILIYDELMI